VPLELSALKLSDGQAILPDSPGATDFLALLNNPALSRAELAQGLINLQAKSAAEAQETDSKRWDDLQKDWQEQGRKDAQVGGAQYDANVAAAKDFANRLGGPKFIEALELTGMANHPEWLRLAVKLVPSFREPGPAPTPAPIAQASRSGRTTTNLYPTQGKK
jgi:hypothetical protein